MNLARLAEENIRNFPEYVSLIFEDAATNTYEECTNVQLYKISNRFANALTKRGVKKGDFVSVILPNSPYVTKVFQAIQKIGATINPIIFALSQGEITYILKDAAPVCVITSPELYPKVKAAADGAVGEIQNIARRSQNHALASRISAAALRDDAGYRAHVGLDFSINTRVVDHDCLRALTQDFGRIISEQFVSHRRRAFRFFHRRQSVHFLSTFLQDGFFPLLAGSDATGIQHRLDEDLPVTRVAGLVDRDDRPDYLVRPVVRYDDGEHTFRNKSWAAAEQH